MDLNLLNNKVIFLIHFGKIVVEYTYIFYENYNENCYASLQTLLEKNHLYEEAVHVSIN